MSAGNQHRSGWALLPLVIILLMMLMAPLLAGERDEHSAGRTLMSPVITSVPSIQRPPGR
jgi:hypothetical protein